MGVIYIANTVVWVYIQCMFNVVDPNAIQCTSNLDPDPGFWPNLCQFGSGSGVILQVSILKLKIKITFEKTIFFQLKKYGYKKNKKNLRKKCHLNKFLVS